MQSCKQLDNRRESDVGGSLISEDAECSLASTVAGDGSPTRVSDFDALAEDDDQSHSKLSSEEGWRPHTHRYRGSVDLEMSPTQDEEEEDAFTLQSALAPPDISRTPFHRRRRDRERQMLPTLLETSSTSSEESPRNTRSLGEFFSMQPEAIILNTTSSKGQKHDDDESELDDDSFFLHDDRDSINDEKENRRGFEERDTSGSNRHQEAGESGMETISSAVTPSSTPSRNQAEILRLKEHAAQLALRGREQDSIDTYRVALRMTRIDLKRIKEQLRSLRQVKKQDRSRRQATLHDDWWNVALIVAEIRTMMGILYERLGHYDRAITCCKEAREVCERQAHLDRVRLNHNKETKSDDGNMQGPQEKVAQLTHMLKQLEVAKSSFVQVRKSTCLLHLLVKICFSFVLFFYESDDHYIKPAYNFAKR